MQPKKYNIFYSDVSIGDYFRFRFWFLYKKTTKPIFFYIKKTETDLNQLVFIWFFLEKNRFKHVWLSFPGLALFFFLLFVSVRFFRFQAYKIETEPVGFFKILIGLICFFSQFGFFGYFSSIVLI